MKKRILIFFLSFVPGLLFFQNILFESYVPINWYNTDNIYQKKGVTAEGSTLFITNSNTQLVFPASEYTLDGIKIKFMFPISENLNIRLSYTSDEKRHFIEENSISKTIYKGYTEIFFPLEGKNYTLFQLDIESRVNMTLELESIELLQKRMDYVQRNAIYFVKILLLVVFCGIISLLLGKIMDAKTQKQSIPSSSKPRDSNIELLRIICMLAIIAHHCVVHGGAVNMEYCLNRVISIYLLPFGKLGFTCFLAISTWFLSDTCFKTNRFIKMWLEVFFYSIGLAFISCVLTDTLTIQYFFGSLLPIAGNSHGFASSYLLLYLLIPFLNHATKSLSKFQARFLLLLLLYAQVFSKIIGVFNQYTQSLSSEILLFVLFYVISINLKRWPIKFFENRVCCGLTFLGVWLLLVQTTLLNVRGVYHEIFQIISSITTDESSLLYILGGYALFMFFKQIHIPTNKYINAIATINFGVLLIHDHNYFRGILWYHIIKCPLWYYSPYFIFYAFASVFIIYVVCGCIDILRQYYLETPLMKCEKLVNLCKRSDEKINFL